MAWQTPKTNWATGNIPVADDFNRIEGNIQELQNTKETPAGAQAKVDTHNASKQGHGATGSYYIAKTSRSDQLPDWNDIQNKPSSYTPSAHTHTPAQISPQGAGSGLDADFLCGKSGINLSLISLLNYGFISKANGSVTFSSNTSLPNNIVFYDNLTINSGVTVSVASSGVNIVYVAGTLTLNGTLTADGKGAAGGASNGGSGAGGNGGGILIVIAKNITGNGTISANGMNGGDGNSPTSYSNGNPGNSGKLFGISINGGNNGIYSYNPSGGAGGTANTKVATIAMMGYMALNYWNSDVGAGGGGSGAANSSSTNYTCGGGGGGAGAYGSGGRGGDGSGAHLSSGGGGGGGGGFIIVASPNPIPSITISAKGGNGGAGYNQAPGGGGGGGGYILVIAPSCSASINVSGGTAGANGIYGSGTANGSPGLVQFVNVI